MAHKYSFIFLGDSGTTIKQIQLSRQKLVGVGASVLIGIILLVYGAVDYIGLCQQVAGKDGLERRLAIQTEEVIHQREQIQKFAAEINAFKDKLVRLDKFEQRIRIIANIDKPNNADGLFGIGGSAPEDLNPQIELTQRHQRLIKDMHQQMGQLNNASAVKSNDLGSLLDKLEAQKNLLAHTPAIRPVKGWITSNFGYRQSPFTGRREFHKGLDIANRSGTEIIATANGVVSYTGQKGLLGNLVVIDHGHGITTRYAHLESALCKRGDTVERGDVIARMGNTGRSTGPHLHYEVRLNGVQVNPTKYILN